MGTYFYKSIFESSFANVEDSSHLGLSLVAEVGENKGSRVQTSIRIYDKFFYREKDAIYIIDKLSVVEFSLGYRYWISEYFSFGLSLGTTYPLGSSESIEKGPEGFDPTIDFNTSSSDITEYYLVGSAQVIAWRSGANAYAFDLQFSKSFSALSGENLDQIGVMFLYKSEIAKKAEIK